MTKHRTDRGSADGQERWSAELEVAERGERFPLGGNLILSESPERAFKIAEEMRAEGHRVIARGSHVRTHSPGRRADRVLTKIRIRYVSKSNVEITYLPTNLGRWLGLEVRRGFAYRSKAEDEDDAAANAWYWWWVATGRYVGRRVERCIEAAPMPGVEELPIEILLGEGGAS